MSKTYELWDTTTRNLIEACAIETDALAFVRAYVAEHGRGYPASWVLLWDDDGADDTGQIAEGPALIARAEAEGRASEAAATGTKRPGG